MAVIEVETVESVNNLEALAEWVPFGRLKSRLSFICADGDGRCRQAALHRQQHSGRRDSYLPLDWRRDAVSSRL